MHNNPSNAGVKGFLAVCDDHWSLDIFKAAQAHGRRDDRSIHRAELQRIRQRKLRIAWHRMNIICVAGSISPCRFRKKWSATGKRSLAGPIFSAQTVPMHDVFGFDWCSPNEIAERVEKVGGTKAKPALLAGVALGAPAGGFIGLSVMLFTLVAPDASLPK